MGAVKVLRGNASIWAVRPEAFADWTIPISLAAWSKALASGLIIDISKSVEDSYSLNATGQATDSSQSMTDVAEIETPTFIEYEASLDIFRNKPGTTDDLGYEQTVSLFNGIDIIWYLVKRTDKLQSAPVEVGDILSSFEVSTDYSPDMTGDSEMTMFGARFKTPGSVRPHLTVTA